jgi:hypothetical protein
VAAIVVVGLAACAVGGENEKKEEPKPNIGTLGAWQRTSNLAEIRKGMFYLDALRGDQTVAVFPKDKSFTDVDVKLQFRVEPVGTGDRAVGLVFGSTDSGTYHCIHIGRREVALCRVSPGQGRVELDRRGGINKPEGSWYEARVECRGPLIRVFFGNRFLFAFKSPDLQPGHVGVYADQSRVWVRRLDFQGKPVRLRTPWKLQ